MSDLERLRDSILGKYLVEEVRIDNEERKELPIEERKKCSYDGDGYVYPAKLDIPYEEIDSFLALKSFEAQMETNNAIVTIKNIVVFIFVVNIIASILLFFLQTQRF
jgi:hypothetical protein